MPCHRTDIFWFEQESAFVLSAQEVKIYVPSFRTILGEERIRI